MRLPRMVVTLGEGCASVVPLSGGVGSMFDEIPILAKS